MCSKKESIGRPASRVPGADKKMAAGFRFSSSKPLVSHVSGTTQHKTWLGAKRAQTTSSEGRGRGPQEIRDAREAAEAEDHLIAPHQTLTLVLSFLTVEVKSEPVWVEGKGGGGGALWPITPRPAWMVDGGPESGSSPGGALRLHSLSVRH